MSPYRMAAPQPKPTTLRDPKYLAHLRTLPCSWCAAQPPNDAAHQGGGRGTATKAPDDKAIPLCRRCHRLTGMSFTKNNVAALMSVCRSGLAWYFQEVGPTFAEFRKWADEEGAITRAKYLGRL